jgi:integral membrane sensor domain MASE1
MFYFVVEVIVVSILVSIFATWIKLIPRYPRKKYSLIQQLANTGLLTAFLTLISLLGVYPSWLLLFAIILVILWLSVEFTNKIVRKAGINNEETRSQ